METLTDRKWLNKQMKWKKDNTWYQVSKLEGKRRNKGKRESNREMFNVFLKMLTL